MIKTDLPKSFETHSIIALYSYAMHIMIMKYNIQFKLNLYRI